MHHTSETSAPSVENALQTSVGNPYMLRVIAPQCNVFNRCLSLSISKLVKHIYARIIAVALRLAERFGMGIAVIFLQTIQLRLIIIQCFMGNIRISFYQCADDTSRGLRGSFDL